MKFYHLFDKGDGLQLGSLGEFDGFDTASDAADKMVAEGQVTCSIWILDEPSVVVLLKSIRAFSLPGVIKEGHARVTEKFIAEYLALAPGTTLFGYPIMDLDRDSLMASAIHAFQLVNEERKQHLSSVEMLTGVAKVKDKLSAG